MTAAVEIIVALGGGAAVTKAFQWLGDYYAAHRKVSVGDEAARRRESIEKETLERTDILTLMREQVAAGDKRAEAAAVRSEILAKALMENAHANQAVDTTLRAHTQATTESIRELCQSVRDLQLSVERSSKIP